MLQSRQAEPPFHQRPRGMRQTRAAVLASDQSDECRRQKLRPARRHEQPVHAVAENFGNRPDRRGHHGELVGHGLQHGKWHTLVAARLDQSMAFREELSFSHVVHRTDVFDDIAETPTVKFFRQRLLIAGRARRAGQGKRHPTAATIDHRKCVKQIVHALPVVEPSQKKQSERPRDLFADSPRRNRDGVFDHFDAGLRRDPPEHVGPVFRKGDDGVGTRKSAGDPSPSDSAARREELIERSSVDVQNRLATQSPRRDGVHDATMKRRTAARVNVQDARRAALDRLPQPLELSGVTNETPGHRFLVALAERGRKMPQLEAAAEAQRKHLADHRGHPPDQVPRRPVMKHGFGSDAILPPLLLGARGQSKGAFPRMTRYPSPDRLCAPCVGYGFRDGSHDRHHPDIGSSASRRLARSTGTGEFTRVSTGKDCGRSFACVAISLTGLPYGCRLTPPAGFFFRRFPVMHQGAVVRKAWTVLAIAGLAGATIADTPTTVKTETGKKIDEYVSRLVPWGFSGTLLVARDGEIVLCKGYGLADRKSRRPMTPDTVMSTGSITKQFTGAAIVKLEAQGKLSVQDPITKFFDDVPEDKRNITLHNLLTHTAGFPGAIGDDFDTSATAENFIRQAWGAKLLWKPGTKYRYSNVGFSIAGIIIEKAAGQSYEQYIHDNLFKPAGMTRTGYLIPKYGDDEPATGYREGKSVGNIVRRPWLPDGPGWHLRANGGVHSTVGDMYKWHRALLDESVLPASAKQKLFAPHVLEEEGSDWYYGYGWVNVKTPRGTTVLMHNGGDGVFAADYRRYIDENVVYYIASNVAEWSGIAVSEFLPRLLFGMEYTLPPEVANLAPDALNRYAGRYALPSGGSIRVTVDEGALVAEADGAEAFAAVMENDGANPQRAERMNERTRTILTAAGQRNYAPLAEAFGQGLSEQEVRERHDGLREEMEQELGAYQSVDVLGSVRQGEAMFSFARLNFARGARHLRLRWEGNQLAGIRPVGGAGRRVFRPQTNSEFASFELTSRSVPKLVFESSDDGRAISLTLRNNAGEVKAGRVD
jgi:CubicO group peptidase (beta-lactamase class C family)